MTRTRWWFAAIAIIAIAAVAWAASHRHARDGRARAGDALVDRVRGVPAPRAGFEAGRDPLAEVLAANRGTSVNTPAAAPDSRRGRASIGTYIVVLDDVPVASYRGGVRGIPAPRMEKRGGAHPRIDMRSEGALEYARHLQSRQAQFERSASGVVGRRIGVRGRMQHAVSAVVMDLRSAEVERVRMLPGVRLVEPYRVDVLASDRGPAVIGAPALWDNSSPFVPASYKGEGIVIGIIDSGINFGSPSFAAVGPVDGYVHANPLGAGTYLGTCAPGGVDAGRCNDKLIGGEDFVCNAPSNLCGQPNVREEPGFGDTHSHGSHVASTAAGNLRDAVFGGRTYRMSGVAPRANLIAYDACYTDTATGQGLCPNSATIAAINRAIADGVDVIHYAIDGGVQPWQEATSLAFLAAVDAGIYVAVSAGNGGPAENTLSHHEPWVASTVASQHGLGGLATLVTVSGTPPVSPYLASMYLLPATDGVTLAASIPGDTPLRVSAGIDSINDGCSAFPANAFAGAIAVLRRGTCALSVKVDNAAAAGALAVIIGNTSQERLVPSVPGTTIPVFGADQMQADAIRDFVFRPPPIVSTAGITVPLVREPNTPDVLAIANSRGPAGDLTILKPDLVAPGVEVLAATSGTQVTGSESLVGLMSGSSMATAHHAGAAALLRQAHPAWTPMEIRSALQLTATSAVTRAAPESTGAPLFERGSGRIRLDRAVRAGLVMDETRANFLAADPANGGQPWALNLPSLVQSSCWRSCTFRRTFRNPTSAGILWRATVWGMRGQVSPALAWIPPGGTQTFDITIETGTLFAPGTATYLAGEVVFEHRVTGGGVDAFRELRVPYAVAVQPPEVTVSGPTQAVANGAGGYTVAVNIGNVGGSVLAWNYVQWGSGTVELADNASRGATTGFRNTTYSDPLQADPPSLGQFAADDFVVTTPTRIAKLEVKGFLPASALPIASATTFFDWSIHADADDNGLPDGDPVNGGAIWSRSLAATSSGMSVSGSSVSLTLPIVGEPLDLPPGRYFLVLSTRSTFANRFAQYASTTQSGRPGIATLTVAPNGTGSWVPVTTVAGLAMRVTYTVNCGTPWLTGASPMAGNLEPFTSEQVVGTINASGLAPGTYRGAMCFQTTDTAYPELPAVPVTLTIP